LGNRLDTQCYNDSGGVMPGPTAGGQCVSGPELAHRIQQMQPGIPVLFMSGYSQDVLGPRDA